MTDRVGRGRKRWLLLGFAMVAILGAHAFLARTPTGQRILETQWGLNVRHFSELAANQSPSAQEEELDRAGEPALSRDSGIFPQGFELTAAATSDGAELFYSTDGSIPTRRHPRFQGSIAFDQTTAFRMNAFGPEPFPSETVTRAFIIGPGTDLPVMSLVVDPVFLFDKHAGIVANPFEHGRAWERPVTFSLLSRGSPSLFQAEGRLRIHGGASRSNERKSLRLYLSQEEGAALVGWFGADAPGVSPAQTEWVLRHVGNRRQLFRDRLGTLIAAQMGLIVSPSLPSVLYVNGELWGVYELRERINAEFLAARLGESDLDFIRGGFNSPEPVLGEATAWYEFLSFVDSSDLSNPEVYEQVLNTIDVDTFINYWILSIFSADADTPHWNLNLVRRRSGDRRWMPVIWDLDGAFNYFGVYTDHDSFAWHLRAAPRPDLHPHGLPDRAFLVEATLVFRRMARNPRFQDAFRSRFQELLRTVLSEETLARTFEDLLEASRSAEEIEIARYPADSTGSSPDTYEGQINEIRTFLSRRPEVMRSLLEQHFPADAGLPPDPAEQIAPGG